MYKVDYKKYFQESIKTRTKIDFNDIKKCCYYLTVDNYIDSDSHYVIVKHGTKNLNIYCNKHGNTTMVPKTEIENKECTSFSDIYEATELEIKWLNRCIERDTFVSLDEIIEEIELLEFVNLYLTEE